MENIKNRYDAKDCYVLWGIENGRTLCENCHKESPSTEYRKLLIIKSYLKRELETYEKSI